MVVNTQCWLQLPLKFYQKNDVPTTLTVANKLRLDVIKYILIKIILH